MNDLKLPERGDGYYYLTLEAVYGRHSAFAKDHDSPTVVEHCITLAEPNPLCTSTIRLRKTNEAVPYQDNSIIFRRLVLAFRYVKAAVYENFGVSGHSFSRQVLLPLTSTCG